MDTFKLCWQQSPSAQKNTYRCKSPTAVKGLNHFLFLFYIYAQHLIAFIFVSAARSKQRRARGEEEKGDNLKPLKIPRETHQSQVQWW